MKQMKCNIVQMTVMGWFVGVKINDITNLQCSFTRGKKENGQLAFKRLCSNEPAWMNC